MKDGLADEQLGEDAAHPPHVDLAVPRQTEHHLGRVRVRVRVGVGVRVRVSITWSGLGPSRVRVRARVAARVAGGGWRVGVGARVRVGPRQSSGWAQAESRLRRAIPARLHVRVMTVTAHHSRAEVDQLELPLGGGDDAHLWEM